MVEVTVYQTPAQFNRILLFRSGGGAMTTCTFLVVNTNFLSIIRWYEITTFVMPDIIIVK